jgi:predicted nucleotidyltransferase
MDADTLSRLLYRIWAITAEVALVYLFGSRVNGATGPLSDVDPGILVDPGSDQTIRRASLVHEVGKMLHGP